MYSKEILLVMSVNLLRISYINLTFFFFLDLVVGVLEERRSIVYFGFSIVFVSVMVFIFYC